MKNVAKVGLVALILAISVQEGSAQIVVRVRPPRPEVVVTNRPAPPSPRHVWVDEDWRPRGRSYEWHGGYWAAPPRTGAQWVPGHWGNRRGGEVWIPGHWR